MLLNRIIVDIFLSQAVGDAVGVPVEFMKREKLKENPVTDMIGYGTHFKKKGTWSDDTSMTLATLSAYSYCTQENNMSNYYNEIMENFSVWYEQGEFGGIFDIGNACKNAIIKYREKDCDAISCGTTKEDDCGNGSLMRITPVAIYMYSNKARFDINPVYAKRVIEEVVNVSSITHKNETCYMGCVIYVFLMMLLIDGISLKESLKIISKFDFKEYFSKKKIKKYKRILNNKILKLKERHIESSGYIVDTLEAAIWSAHNATNLRETILKAVNLGGDTDTIASLAAGLGCLLYTSSSIKDWEIELKKKDVFFEYVREFADTICPKNN